MTTTYDTITSSETIQVATVGCGEMGRIHTINFIKSGAQVCSLYDTDITKAIRLNEELHLGARICQSLEEVLNSGVKIAVIAPSPEGIASTAIATAQAGIHSFIEKPIGQTLAEALQVEHEVEANRVIADVNHQYDVDPAGQEIGRLIDAGTLGQVHHVRFSHQNEDMSGGERDRVIRERLKTEGIMRDSGIHRTRMLLRWLDPLDVLEIGGFSLRTDPRLEEGVVNFQAAWLTGRQQNGAQLTFYCDIGWFAPGATNSRAFGLTSPVHPYWHIVTEEVSVWWKPRDQKFLVCGPNIGDEPRVYEFPKTDIYLEKVRQFLQVIKGEADVTCPVSEACRALAVTIELDNASRLGGAIQSQFLCGSQLASLTSRQ